MVTGGVTCLGQPFLVDNVKRARSPERRRYRDSLSCKNLSIGAFDPLYRTRHISSKLKLGSSPSVNVGGPMA